MEEGLVALAYGKQRGYEGSKYSEHQIFHPWSPDASNFDQVTAFCNNANAAIRKSLWEAHPYDETLTGLEDLEWGKWAKGQGHKIAYVAEAEIIHIHNETPHGVYNRYRREAMALRNIYPETNFNLYDFLRLTFTNIVSDLWHATREGVLLKSLASIFWFRFMQFHGTRIGHRETSLVTPQLRETFYYARERKKKDERKRDVEPIRYGYAVSVQRLPGPRDASFAVAAVAMPGPGPEPGDGRAAVAGADEFRAERRGAEGGGVCGVRDGAGAVDRGPDSGSAGRGNQFNAD